MSSPIGIFDSGYGGLSILEEIHRILPKYDYIYLGDNARAPYGTRSFDIVYQFTLEAVKRLFEMNCKLVILACNTASAKALRTIQQNDLPQIDPNRRVLGVIRPTIESIGAITQTRHVGLLGTQGTISSQSYPLEIAKLFPDIVVEEEACPMWVPLVENQEYNTPGADYFVQKHINNILSRDTLIDTLILGCTHYPFLEPKIRQYLPSNIQIVSQGHYVAESLKDYLHRHPEMDAVCSKNSICEYYTTESPEKFSETASIFMQENIQAKQLR
ncbi:MAG: glutamate racemase [Dysgonamonadaceae bacterium]|jgi:glutamate racemase|nr:glutamate racemase [Dysgonamonadaceae bacterium]